MYTIRQDAWSHDEDLLLAETVLRFIREGGTQLQSFEQVGVELSRTAAACGFRWNSFVRKRYKEAIELAKQARKESKGTVVEREIKEETVEKDITLQEVIQFLQRQKQDRKKNVEKENEALKREMEQLQQQITKIHAEKLVLIERLHTVEEDYKSFIEIMERARKMTFLEDREKKIKFQMDKNGNLERMES